MMGRTINCALPDFVQAAETVLAVPKGGGKDTFTKRAQVLLPNLRTHWYVGGNDLDQRLRELYQDRSDCVHGMVPFQVMQRDGEAGCDKVARSLALAQALARGALVHAFSHPEIRPEMETRAKLERSWRDGFFPLAGQPGLQGRSTK